MNKLQHAWNKLTNKVPEDRRIILNQIQTPDGTIIKSVHRHDYVTHEDKNGNTYMVDGGTEYLRRNLVDEAPYTELTIYDDAPYHVIRQLYCRGGRGKNGDQPLTWVPLEKMSDAWLVNVIEYNEDRGMGKVFSTQMYRKELEYRKTNKITVADV